MNSLAQQVFDAASQMNRETLAKIRLAKMRAALENIVEEGRGTNRPDGVLISHDAYEAVLAALA
jgi:hypothetical protein